MASCRLHAAASVAGTCRGCHDEFCEECLVYAYGESSRPFCVRCALLEVGAQPAARPATPGR